MNQTNKPTTMDTDLPNYHCMPDSQRSAIASAELGSGVDLIAHERRRQIEKEGWTTHQDRSYKAHELVRAAITYAMPEEIRELSVFNGKQSLRSFFWPFSEGWWKPTPDTRIRELVKAGALIAAEIDRIRGTSLRDT